MARAEQLQLVGEVSVLLVETGLHRGWLRWQERGAVSGFSAEAARWDAEWVRGPVQKWPLASAFSFESS